MAIVPEKDAYLEKSREGIQAAKVLLLNGFYNIAISTAYFSMLHAAIALLLKENCFFTLNHRDIIGAFDRWLVKPGHVKPYFYDLLYQAHEARFKADYNFTIRYTADDAHDYIIFAEKFLQMSEELLC